MLGGFKKTTKRNLLKGIPWRFGPNWPGKRCEAKTRKGTPCQRPAKLPVGRCRLHGGDSTGPRTEEGLKRLADSIAFCFDDVVGEITTLFLLNFVFKSDGTCLVK